MNAGDPLRHGADAHREVFDVDGATARCSLWWNNTPRLDGYRLGLIGHYAANSAEAARRLLAQSCRELAAHRCTLAVGPMDGSTWRQYRFVTDRGSEPPFFLEPENPPEWPQHFVESGFAPLANYHSSIIHDLDEDNVKARRAGDRLNRLGVKLRSLDLARWEEELKAIFEVSTASFSKGFLYQSCAEAEFLAQYQSIRPFLRPELVLLANHGSRVVGFVFAIPDVRQGAIDTAILKTLAIVLDPAYAGLGGYLTQETHRVARQLGFRRMIHALMHEANPSVNISARYGKPFRRYTLFARQL